MDITQPTNGVNTDSSSNSSSSLTNNLTWFGSIVLNSLVTCLLSVFLLIILAIDFVGEVVADFIGITDSRYQYVVDAKIREKERRQFEKEQEREATELLTQTRLAQIEQKELKTNQNELSQD